jgi:hypothetical protein
LAQTSAKPTLGVWGRAPKKLTRLAVFIFSRKEAKAMVVLVRRIVALGVAVFVAII